MFIKKCILCYGLEDDEISKFKELGFNVKIIENNMAEVKIKDIINNVSMGNTNIDLPKEKVILFNGYDNKMLKPAVNKTRQLVPGCILAVVTPVSSTWKFIDLLKHLIEEREWANSNKKG